MDVMTLQKRFRHVPNFPKEGIDFIDITTVLGDGESFAFAIDALAKVVKESGCNVIVGSEARGFILGAPVAYKLGLGFVPVRKKGKLPYKTVSGTYDLEYGTDTLEMHIDAVKAGDKVAIVDDLIATGGTVSCIADMVKRCGAKVVTTAFLIELTDLPGRAVLEKQGLKVETIIEMTEEL